MSDVCHNVGLEPILQLTHHQREATPQHCQHRRWSMCTCWHQGTGVLWKW